MERDEALREFLALRALVDEDEILDGFDFALGWLLGKGVSHPTAVDWIDAWADAEKLTWPARENLKASEEDAKRRREMIDQAIKDVSE